MHGICTRQKERRKLVYIWHTLCLTTQMEQLLGDELSCQQFSTFLQYARELLSNHNKPDSHGHAATELQQAIILGITAMNKPINENKVQLSEGDHEFIPSFDRLCPVPLQRINS